MFFSFSCWADEIEIQNMFFVFLSSFSINLLALSRMPLSDWLSYSLSIEQISRFHVAVRLFSNRSQMTSKCGKNKKMARR